MTTDQLKKALDAEQKKVRQLSEEIENLQKLYVELIQINTELSIEHSKLLRKLENSKKD